MNEKHDVVTRECGGGMEGKKGGRGSRQERCVWGMSHPDGRNAMPGEGHTIYRNEHLHVGHICTRAGASDESGKHSHTCRDEWCRGKSSRNETPKGRKHSTRARKQKQRGDGTGEAVST